MKDIVKHIKDIYVSGKEYALQDKLILCIFVFVLILPVLASFLRPYHFIGTNDYIVKLQNTVFHAEANILRSEICLQNAKAQGCNSDSLKSTLLNIKLWCWVVLAWGFTLLYTAYHFFAKLNKKFRIYSHWSDASWTIPVVIINMVAIGLIYYSFLQDNLAFGTFIMAIVGFLFCVFNWIHYDKFHCVREQFTAENFDPNKIRRIKVTDRITVHNQYERAAELFKTNVLTGDLPLTATLLLLALFGFLFENSDTIRAFFSGAIAFQLMFSNSVWLFSDSDILEDLPELID